MQNPKLYRLVDRPIHAVVMIAVLALLLPQAAMCFADQKTDIKHFKAIKFCSYYGGKIGSDLYLFPPDQGATDAVNRIVTRAGILNNFALYAANVPNAVATMVDGKRAILYNQNFMLRLKDNRDWAAVSILAHEIAHHIHGDPLSSDSASQRREMELQADRYSGFILEQMGASFNDAQAAINEISTDSGSATHPPKAARLAAVTNGWRSAYDIGEKIKTAKNTSDKPENPTAQKRVTEVEPPKASDPTPDLVAEITFDNNSTRYFLSAGGNIMSVTSFPSKTVVFGRQLPSINPRWAWQIQTPRGVFLVDKSGAIWGKAETGEFVQVGYVTKMNPVMSP